MADNSFKDFVLEQLDSLDGITSRAMFGGHGLYYRGVFFAIISQGMLYFKTDEESRQAYEQRGMPTFGPAKSYHEVPAEILEDSEQLVEWAQRAIAVKQQTKTKINPRKSGKES
jgi:DNA transformation protein and related proteins